MKDEELVKRLAALGARIALSFDTFDKETDMAAPGRAPACPSSSRCLELCEKHGVDVTLIPVMTRGVNDHEIGQDSHAGARKQPNVRHVEVHTMTFTGQSGATFARGGRISMYEVLQRIEETTGALLRPDDFVPSPCAHPLCYQIAYLLLDPDGGPPDSLHALRPAFGGLGGAVRAPLPRAHPSLEEALRREAIDRLWAEGGDESERALRLLKRLLGMMFPSDRPLSREEALRVSERASKAVYVHSHMDEETFDTERLAQCCDMNCYADGTQIPVCNYNVLYRETETHFNVKPRILGNERSAARSPSPFRCRW